MTNSKQKMSASYKAIFILSIFMCMVCLMAGKSIGIFIWGYIAWLMYERKVSSLVSFSITMLWFEIIAFSVALAFSFFGDIELGGYSGGPTLTVINFGLVISISYGLYMYFSNLSSNKENSTSAEINSDPPPISQTPL